MVMMMLLGLTHKRVQKLEIDDGVEILMEKRLARLMAYGSFKEVKVE